MTYLLGRPKMVSMAPHPETEMLIQIRHRFTAAVLFEHNCEDNTLKLTLKIAIERKVDLSYSNLSGSNLSYSDLRGSNLSYSDLRDSNLSYSDLRDSDLSGSNLSDSNLRGSNLRDSDLLPIKADFIEIISRAPREVPALIAALKEGRVDGSTYEGPCACLVGTIANVRGADYRDLSPDSSRPAERFFMAIKRGDTPETNSASKIALEWAEQFHATMLAAYAPAATE